MDLQKLHNTKKVVYSRNEVAQHTREGDTWVIIEDDVYDLSQFLHEHPGGVKGNLFSCEITVECTISHAFDSSTRSRRPRCNEEIQEVPPAGDSGQVQGAPSPWRTGTDCSGAWKFKEIVNIH